MVSHDTKIIKYADRYTEMCQGKIVDDTNPDIHKPAEKTIIETVSSKKNSKTSKYVIEK